MVKPGELIDVVEMTPLTLTDRRIFNQLIAYAWDRIADDAEHVIAKTELRGTHNGNERIGDSIERLMSAIVRVKIERNGKPATLRVQLLAPNSEDKAADGMLRYRFSAEMRAIILHSATFGRLRHDVMLALQSKYALALYEMVQKRGNLRHQWSQEFTVEELRALLGVPKGKLPRFANFHNKALKPAVAEVNSLGDYGIKLAPVKSGRTVVAVKLSWWRKNEDELKAAFTELRRHSAGRRARLAGKVETLDVSGQLTN
jgi:hypothetical protein